MRPLLGAAALALIATACTAIVAGELKKYDDYKVSNSTFPGDNTDPCVLDDPDASNECSRCINDHCGDASVTYGCRVDGGPKSWFSDLQACAQHPFEVHGGPYESYSCGDYNDPDAQPYHTGEANEYQQATLLCVRDNCLGGDKPACHQCKVEVEKPGLPGEYANLEDGGQCGKCLYGNCRPLIVECCSNLPPDLGACGYTGASELSTKCSARLHQDAGGPDAEPTKGAPPSSDWCAWKFAKDCFPLCASQCP